MTLVLDPATARGIAHNYLPSRWHYHYGYHKLLGDPLFVGVCAALNATDAPILDLGCGMGLLAHCLRAAQLPQRYLGVDNDVGKIALARRASMNLTACRFECVDLAQDFPTHQGQVVILDVLQYLPQAAQQQLLERACACLTPGAKLIIRSGLNDPGWRTRITHAADLFGRAIRWMNTHPKHYPSRDELQRVFDQWQLKAEFTPLWGNTPFNNWLITAQR